MGGPTIKTLDKTQYNDLWQGLEKLKKEGVGGKTSTENKAGVDELRNKFGLSETTFTLVKNGFDAGKNSLELFKEVFGEKVDVVKQQRLQKPAWGPSSSVSFRSGGNLRGQEGSRKLTSKEVSESDPTAKPAGIRRGVDDVLIKRLEEVLRRLTELRRVKAPPEELKRTLEELKKLKEKFPGTSEQFMRLREGSDKGKLVEGPPKTVNTDGKVSLGTRGPSDVQVAQEAANLAKTLIQEYPNAVGVGGGGWLNSKDDPSLVHVNEPGIKGEPPYFKIDGGKFVCVNYSGSHQPMTPAQFREYVERVNTSVDTQVRP